MLENQAPVIRLFKTPLDLDRTGLENQEADAPISERQRPFRFISKMEKLGPLESNALMEAPGPKS